MLSQILSDVISVRTHKEYTIQNISQWLAINEKLNYSCFDLSLFCRSKYLPEYTISTSKEYKTIRVNDLIVDLVNQDILKDLERIDIFFDSIIVGEKILSVSRNRRREYLLPLLLVASIDNNTAVNRFTKSILFDSNVLEIILNYLY